MTDYEKFISLEKERIRRGFSGAARRILLTPESALIREIRQEEKQHIEPRLNKLARLQDIKCQTPGCENQIPRLRGRAPKHCHKCHTQHETERQRAWRRSHPERYVHQKWLYVQKRRRQLIGFE